MSGDLMNAIRQQSDDLRDELKDLEEWEDQMMKTAEARKARKIPVSDGTECAVEPPIRGSVPSIKQAMAEQAKVQGKQLAPKQDPIQLAKEKGNEFFRLNKTKEAIEAYTAGIDLDPNSHTTSILYGNRAMCYIKLSEWEKAERDATMCVQMNRGYAKGYFRRGVARKNLGKLKEARADLESVLALQPNDASAIAELEAVTKKLQAERASTSTATVLKKKIVIEEVEDEDGEDEGGETAEATSPTPPPAASAQTADDAARESRIQKQLAELEETRRVNEEARRSEVLREEKKMEACRRHDPRVELVEEEEKPPEIPKKVKVEPAKPQPTCHADPSPAEGDGAFKPAKKEDTSSAARKPASPAPAVSVRIRALPAKESLKPPQSFSDFERDFVLIEGNDELRDHYVSLLSPASLVTLFGSSMTPEMLSGLLRSAQTMPAGDALKFMKGLSKVNRVGELVMFFNDDEEQLVHNVAALVKQSGAPDAEVNAVMKAFQVF